MDDGIHPPETVVYGVSYKPFGPLSALTLGNGLTEARGFDRRYQPTAITIGALFQSVVLKAIG